MRTFKYYVYRNGEYIGFTYKHDKAKFYENQGYSIKAESIHLDEDINYYIDTI